jgi:hypothetical protein
MREISTDVRVAMGSNPSLSSGPKGAQPLGNQGNRAPENTPNSHVTHTAAVPGDALPSPENAPDSLGDWGVAAPQPGRPVLLTDRATGRAVSLEFHPDDPHAQRFATGAVELSGAHPAAPAEETQPSGSAAPTGEGSDPDLRRPAPRHCTETWEEGDGERVMCSAVLTDGLRCTVCEGQRCYAHCGSVDHYADATLHIDVPFGRTRVVRAVRTPGGLYCGHLAVLESDGRWHVLVKQSSLDVGKVLDELMALAQERPESDPSPAAGDGEPDGDLPATDDPGLMFLPLAPPPSGVYQRDDGYWGQDITLPPGLGQRHAPLVELVMELVAESLASLDDELLDALTVAALADPSGEGERWKRLFGVPEAHPSHRARLVRTAHKVVTRAFACKDPDTCDVCPELQAFAGRFGVKAPGRTGGQ